MADQGSSRGPDDGMRIAVLRALQEERLRAADRLKDLPGHRAPERRAATRETRLRPEFAPLYPFLSPEVWESAAVVTDKVIAWRLRQRVGGLPQRDRVLDPEHFQFRDSPRAVVDRG